MITKKFYLLAKEIVSEYEYKLNKPKLSKGDLHLGLDLKRGDYVIYIGGRETRYLTKGKEYRLTGTLWENIRGNIMISIINDKGNRYISKSDYFTIKK